MLFITALFTVINHSLENSNPYKTHRNKRKKDFFRKEFETYDDIKYIFFSV